MNTIKSKRTLIIIIVFVLIAALGLGYYFFFMNKDDSDKEPVSVYYPLKDPFVTNVKDSGKLFKATIILVVNSEDLTELLDAKLYLIRDEILFILRSMTEEDISRQDIQEELRTKIPARLNEVLQIESFISVVFSDFVMQ